MTPRSILVVDASELLAPLMARLEALGHRLAGPAFSISDGLRLARDFTPDAVLLGCQSIGALDAVAVCAQIRGVTDAPIILVTDSFDNHTLARAQAAAPYALLITPCQDGQLPAPISAISHENDPATLYLRHELGVHQTELLQQNEALRETRDDLERMRDKYVDLYDFAPAGYLTLDAQGVITEANLACGVMLGKNRAWLTGTNFARYLAANDAGQWYLHLQQVFEGRTGLSCEATIAHGQEPPMDVHIESAFFLGSDGQPQCRCAIMDVTQRKSAENALRAIQRFNAGIIESSNDCIKMLDSEGRLVFMNANGAKLLEIDDARVCYTKGYVDFWRGSDAEAASQALESARQGQAGRFEGYCPTVTGKPKWWDVVITPLAAGSGLPGSFLVVSRDATERKLGQDALERAKISAESANRAKSEFLANMSHEIRTPLNGVLGTLQLLEDTPLNEEQKEYAEVALQSGWGLLSIINDILNLSQIESGMARLTAECFSLEELFRQVRRTLEPQAKSKGIALTCTLDASVPSTMIGDEGRLRQVLFNLVGNALKFSHRGTVSMEVFALPEATADGRRRLVITVSDQGIGIPDEKLGLLFTPFTQVDGSLNRKYQGTGLGLSIVKRLVAMMGGTLCVDSEEGRGTTVCFSTLVTLGKAAASCVNTHKHLGRSLRVLVVEDDKVNRLTSTRLLEKEGHAVTGVEDGYAALEILEHKEFDCIFMDIQMPGIDGLETTRRIRQARASGSDKDVPVIALTAHALDDDRQRFLDAGLDGYLSKPFDREMLRQELTRVFARSLAR